MKSFVKLKLVFLTVLLLLSQTSMGQTKQIQGRVISSEGMQALPGVSITVKGRNASSKTNENGHFNVNASIGETLLFTYVGFERREVLVGTDNNLSITLTPTAQILEDVVVVGYGTQRKRDLTGSIVNLSGKDLIPTPAASFDQLMQGRVAGAQITQTTGSPGGNVNVVIRGINSITGGNQPLYVIDGFAIGAGGSGSDASSFNGNSYSSSGMANNTVAKINPLSTINPSDIASIEILKDASATAIYGSRGANGVVIITTKRGSKGQSSIQVEASGGLQQVANKLDMMNAREFAEFVAEGRDNAWILAGGNASDPNEVRNGATSVKPEFRNPGSITTNTDWQDVIFRTAPVQNYLFSTSGGQQVVYNVSAGYFDQQGTIKNSDFKRFNIRTNLDVDLTEHLKLGVSVAGSHAYGNFARAEGHLGQRGLIATALANSPALAIYNPDGSYTSDLLDPFGVPVENPLLVIDEFSDRRYSTQVFNNNYLEYKVNDDLTIKTSIGINYNSNNTKLWKSSEIGQWGVKTSPATAGVNQQTSLNWLNENTVTYNKHLGEKHRINAVAGFSAQKDRFEILQAGATDFPTDYIHYIGGGNVNAGNNYISEWAMLSMFGRINYTFADKWLFTGTVRRDGSSRFGTNNRWGTFPSASVGYRLSEEGFMKNQQLINDLKIRASYGESGNNLIGNYAHIGLLGTTSYVNNGAPILGIVPAGLANAELTWERSQQTNLGMDVAFWNSRLNLSIDIYRNLKKDLLLNNALPAISGFLTATQNIGELENKGLEIALNTENIRSTDFSWSTNFNISFNKNKVLKLSTVGSRISNSTYQITEVGKPISSFFLLHAIGVFKDWDEVNSSPLVTPNTQPGDVKFADVNGDGRISDDDKTIVGNPMPDYTFGFNNSFRYKNLTLNVSVVGSQGQEVYFQGGEILLNSAGVQNQLALANDRWRSPERPGAGLVPRAIRSDYARGQQFSSRYLFDGSFVRVKNINLAYRFPERLLKQLNVPGLTIYGDVANAFTFTNYPSYDPEVSSTGDNIAASGVDYFGYPLARTFTIGIRATLK
ncbi:MULTISPECIES: SusC/RagA family TonB-linked outer membrane protein [Olivibacter]|uniref:SusC/RagA family TonB-linked outer membrane protein n=1 Tax=Olivibacter jilunii TaxID=985016 RepID=A0ABW6ASF5_9SPHI